MPLILRPTVLWAVAGLLLLLMLGSVVMNYHQLQQVRDLRDSIARIQKQGEQLHSKRQALRAQVSYELSRERIGDLQQRYLPQLKPLKQFISFEKLPFLDGVHPRTKDKITDVASPSLRP